MINLLWTIYSILITLNFSIYIYKIIKSELLNAFIESEHCDCYFPKKFDIKILYFLVPFGVLKTYKRLSKLEKTINKIKIEKDDVVLKNVFNKFNCHDSKLFLDLKMTLYTALISDGSSLKRKLLKYYLDTGDYLFQNKKCFFEILFDDINLLYNRYLSYDRGFLIKRMNPMSPSELKKKKEDKTFYLEVFLEKLREKYQEQKRS